LNPTLEGHRGEKGRKQAIEVEKMQYLEEEEARRNPDGTFKKGYSGNPGGRPPRTTEEQYMGTLEELITSEDVKDVVSVALSRAKAGDWRARRWLFNYFWGKPREMIRVQAMADIELEWRDGDPQEEREHGLSFGGEEREVGIT